MVKIAMALLQWMIMSGWFQNNSVLSYISGLCTAAVEQLELHKDNMFTLNSEIPSRQSMWPMLSIIFSYDECCMVLVYMTHGGVVWAILHNDARRCTSTNLQSLNSLSLHHAAILPAMHEVKQSLYTISGCFIWASVRVTLHIEVLVFIFEQTGNIYIRSTFHVPFHSTFRATAWPNGHPSSEDSPQWWGNQNLQGDLKVSTIIAAYCKPVSYVGNLVPRFTHRAIICGLRRCANVEEHTKSNNYYLQGRQKRGGWGGPSRPTFRGKLCLYSKSS